MSIYRGSLLIAAGGRDVNPNSILSGCNIYTEVSADGNCVTINTCDCPTFCSIATECLQASTQIDTCDLKVCGCILDQNGCCYLGDVVTSPGCPDQKICCLTEAQYQTLVSGGTVDADTYYYTPGNSTVTSSDFSCFCAGSGITLTCSGGEMSIATDALNNICASNDITVTQSAGCVYIGRNTNDTFHCVYNGAVASVTYGCLNSFCVSGLCPGIYLAQPYFNGSAYAWFSVNRNMYFNTGNGYAAYRLMRCNSWTDFPTRVYEVTGDCIEFSFTVGEVADETCVTTCCTGWVGCSRGCIRVMLTKVSSL